MFTRGSSFSAERIRKAVQGLKIQAGDSEISLRVSIGVTAFASVDSAEMLVERADRAMYRAKTAGRNRVEIEPSAAVPGEPGVISA